MKATLSKSQYCRGRQCLKRLWLYNHRRDLRQAPSDFQEGLFEQGREVGLLAQGLYPGGVLIHEDHRDPHGALAHTQAALNAGASALFEAAFQIDDIVVRVDILEKQSTGQWRLGEVKSSTDANDVHLVDLAVQHYVVSRAGLKLSETLLLHLNRDYVRGNTLDLGALFKAESLADEIADELARVPAELALFRETLKGAEPVVEIGSICRNPYPCEFQAHCWQGVGPTSIHHLTRISDKKRAELRALGISEITEIPESVSLSEQQRVQRACALSKERYVERQPLKKFLEQLRYPLSFLDFETVAFAIPRYAGTRPYQQLGVQFSLHVQEAPDATLSHHEFLSEGGDPRRAFVESLLAALPKDGSIVVYNESFERGILESLGRDFPEHQSALSQITARFWDLHAPFQKRWWAEAKFEGRSTIKKVLPALVPDLSYDGLAIAKGDTATRKYVEMIDPACPPSSRAEIKNNLLEYCALDTLAMQRILKVVEETVR